MGRSILFTFVTLSFTSFPAFAQGKLIQITLSPYFAVAADEHVDLKEPKPGEERAFDLGNGVQMKFCWILGSKDKFKIGSPKAEQDFIMNTSLAGKRYWVTEFGRSSLDDENEVEVAGVNGFWMAKYTITQTQYVKLTGKRNPSWFAAESGGKDKVRGLDTSDFPVEQVSWNDAKECIKMMKVPSGMKKISLPSEVQWEWAARGGLGNGHVFYWGDKLLGDEANCDGNHPYGSAVNGPYLERTAKVGSYEHQAPHPWGLCDMAGNVWQWCEDYFAQHEKLPDGKNPVQTAKQMSNNRSLRGGCWCASAGYSRSAYRWGLPPDARMYMTGFRVLILP
jgi:formylglycine-generating enzyme required for sulfatase activity